MSGNEGLQEGSRKRIKISRTASRPVSAAPPSPIVIPSDTPVKPEHAMPAQNGLAVTPGGAHIHDGECHHEESLRTLNADMESMRQLITCKMCYRFLYEPFGLPCGHTYCYSCLATWMGNSKTCPDCRAVVKEPPNPTYLIREMVRVFTNRSELLPDGETREEHAKHAQEEADIVAKDKANDDAQKGGLFRGVFRRGTRRHPYEAIWDDSDRVSRCPLCTGEIEVGRCFNCDIRVRGPDDGSELSDSEDETGDELDEELADMDGDDIDLGLDGHADFGGYDSDGAHDQSSDIDLVEGHFIRGMREADFNQRGSFHHLHSEEEEDDEEDEDDDEDLEGFVDDEVRYEDEATADGTEEDWETENTATNHRGHGHRRGEERIDLVSDDGEESEDDMALRHRVVPHFQRAHQHPSVDLGRDSEAGSSSDEEDDDEQPIRSSTQRARAAQGQAPRRRPITIDSDEDEDGDATNGDQVDFSNHVAAMGNFSPVSERTEEDGAHHDNAFDFDNPYAARTWDYGFNNGASVDLVSDDDGHSEMTGGTAGDDEDDDDDDDDDDEEEEDDGEEEDDDGDDDDETNFTYNPRPNSTNAYTHRLHTLGPRRNRYRNLPDHDTIPSNRRWGGHAHPPQASRVPAEIIHRTINSHRTQPHGHPFQLSSTLDRINRNRQPSFADTDTTGGVEVNSAASRSSGSSRTLEADDRLAAARGRIRRRLGMLDDSD